ncbi:MAG: phosphoglycerate kinase [Candidatus Paceibacterota bacterium]
MHTAKLPDITTVENLKGRYVLLRASFNVPIVDGAVRDSFRIERALTTLQYLVSRGARVILIAHIGRKKIDSLRPVYDALQKHMEIKWCGKTLGENVQKMRDSLTDSEILLLENVRQHEEEKENNDAFAQSLASLADIYINDAFSDSHRKHASIVGIPKHIPSYFGCSFIREYTELSRARVPESPSLFILGGAKFETKLPLVEQYLTVYDNVFVGGALAHDIWRAKGFEIGKSLVSGVDLTEQSIITAPNLLLPIDVTVQLNGNTRIKTPETVTKEETIVDAGPQTVAMLEQYITKAETILWNGTLGKYEDGFDTATKQLARITAEAPGNVLMGGGDTVASIGDLNLEDQFEFVSTAGGAMLYFLEHGSLPAIDAVVTR